MQYLNLQLYLPEKTKTASKNPCLIAFSPPVPSDLPGHHSFHLRSKS